MKVLNLIERYLDPDFWLEKDLELNVEGEIKSSKTSKLKRFPCKGIGYAICVFLRIPTDYKTCREDSISNIYSSLSKKGYSLEQINSAFNSLNSKSKD